MQQRSKQSSRDADRTTTRETELALWQEEIAVRREEMMLQLQIQRNESPAHQQMMNVMLMAMMQNIGGSNQQQRADIVGGLRTEISGTNMQSKENNE